MPGQQSAVSSGSVLPYGALAAGSAPLLSARTKLIVFLVTAALSYAVTVTARFAFPLALEAEALPDLPDTMTAPYR